MIKKKEKNHEMKKIGKLSLILLIELLSLQLLAAQVQVRAAVDRNQMGIGDAFTVNVRVQSDEDFDLKEPRLPEIQGLELLNSWAGGRQTSSSMSMLNGKAEFKQTVSQDYNFMMAPQKEGTFIIPSLDVDIKGQTYKTTPLKIQVAEEFRQPNKKKQQRVPGRPQFPPGFGGDDDETGSPFGLQDDEDDLFNQLMKRQQQLLNQFQNGPGGGFGQPMQRGPIQSRKLDVDVSQPFFVYLDVDKKEVYVGEQITANWYIYTRNQLESLDRAKFPDLKGFWKEIIEEVPALQFVPEIVNGVTLNKALLASHALFPIKPGSVTIDDFQIKAKVRTQNQFGWGGSQVVTKSSKNLTLKVLPLPQEGQPETFSGAVGSYKISVKTNGQSLTANQPFSVKIRFEGEGNAKLIDLPKIQWPSQLEVFDTKTDSKYFKDGLSYKEFEVLLVARQTGDVVIPSISFSFFDPRQKKYVIQNSEEIKLTIAEGSAAAAVNPKSGASNSVAASVEEVKPQPILELPQSSVISSINRPWVYAGLLALILLTLLVQFVWQMKSLYREPEFPMVVNSKLKKIEQHMTTSMSESAYRKIGGDAVNLIYLLGSHLAGHRQADQEWSLLIKDIPFKSQNLYMTRLTQLLDYFQLLGFSPSDVVKQLVAGNPLSPQIDELKKISHEILKQADAEEKSDQS